MPWHGRQQRAIAARLRREGKTPAQISAFFRKHGNGDKSNERRLARGAKRKLRKS